MPADQFGPKTKEFGKKQENLARSVAPDPSVPQRNAGKLGMQNPGSGSVKSAESPRKMGVKRQKKVMGRRGMHHPGRENTVGTAQAQGGGSHVVRSMLGQLRQKASKPNWNAAPAGHGPKGSEGIHTQARKGQSANLPSRGYR